MEYDCGLVIPIVAWIISKSWVALCLVILKGNLLNFGIMQISQSKIFPSNTASLSSFVSGNCFYIAFKYCNEAFPNRTCHNMALFSITGVSFSCTLRSFSISTVSESLSSAKLSSFLSQIVVLNLEKFSTLSSFAFISWPVSSPISDSFISINSLIIWF